MTLRDRFAIAWITGLNRQWHNRGAGEEEAIKDRKEIVREAYALADAMLAERCVGQGSAAKGCVVDPDLEKLADQIERRNGLK